MQATPQPNTSETPRPRGRGNSRLGRVLMAMLIGLLAAVSTYAARGVLIAPQIRRIAQDLAREQLGGELILGEIGGKGPG